MIFLPLFFSLQIHAFMNPKNHVESVHRLTQLWNQKQLDPQDISTTVQAELIEGLKSDESDSETGVYVVISMNHRNKLFHQAEMPLARIPVYIKANMQMCMKMEQGLGNGQTTELSLSNLKPLKLTTNGDGRISFVIPLSCMNLNHGSGDHVMPVLAIRHDYMKRNEW